jgi:hypothetical protein
MYLATMPLAEKFPHCTIMAPGGNIFSLFRLVPGGNIFSLYRLVPGGTISFVKPILENDLFFLFFAITKAY